MDVTGSSCVLCGQPIASLFDGTFCSECGGPYHHHCVGESPVKPASQPCQYCRGDVSDPQAVATRASRLQASVSHGNLPPSPRSFSRVDAKRLVAVPILLVLAVCYWFLLPALQSLIVPNSSGGKAGPWLVRPILAFHYGAVVVMAAVTLPLAMRPLHKAWKRQDAALGTRYDPFQGRGVARALLLVYASLLLVIYAAALFFYLFSWVVIGPDGIVQRLPWTTLTHSFEDVALLETVPDGERSDSILKNGPWYTIRFKSGRSIDLGEENEGMTREELSAMTAFISQHSGLPWTRRKDARPHQVR